MNAQALTHAALALVAFIRRAGRQALEVLCRKVEES
jgi:hypothetical protein